MKKLIFIPLIILGLLSLFGCGAIPNGDENGAKNGGETAVTVIETDLVFTIEDIADTFNAEEPFYFIGKGEMLKLNGVEPKGFYYLNGVLLAYVYESEEECNKAIQNINEAFTEDKLLDAGIVEFKQGDFEPIFHKANNAVVAYIPRYTVRAKISQSMERLLFIKGARAKGITERMITTLGNLGYSEQEILDLPWADIERIFAPGTHMDGGGFDPDDIQKSELAKVGIDVDMSIILFNLGYEYEEMVGLSSEELDFIFPNTQLIANLVDKGFDEQEVQSWAVNGSGKTYKELIKEALER